MDDAIPPGDEHLRPARTDDATVAAVGKLTEALEWVERARGRLYDFHQLIGHADGVVGDAADALEDAGHGDLASQVREEIVGRNVLPGRWTFQVVEEFDDLYWAAVRGVERRVRERLLDGRRHVFESEMKEARRTRGHPDHSARPDA